MEKGYNKALLVAVEKIKQTAPERIEENCGAEWFSEDNIIKIRYFNKTYSVKYPEIKFLNGQNLSEKEKILILHYLASPGNSHHSETCRQYISFREIKTGTIYFPSFEDRVIKPLIATYGGNPELFIQKSLVIGGSKSSFSKYSIIFRIFPKVEVMFALYPADEELPAGASVLFNPSITDFLDIEDIAIVCEESVNKFL